MIFVFVHQSQNNKTRLHHTSTILHTPASERKTTNQTKFRSFGYVFVHYSWLPVVGALIIIEFEVFLEETSSYTEVYTVYILYCV